jgi:hypothetical protein
MAWLRLVEELVAASVASACLGGSGAAPVLGGGPAVTGVGAGRHGPAGPAAAAVLGRRVDRRPLAAMVGLEGEAVVAAHP